MDHQLIVAGAKDDEFDEVPSTVRTDDDVAGRILAKLRLGDRVLVGVLDVLVSNPMVARRSVNLHTG